MHKDKGNFDALRAANKKYAYCNEHLVSSDTEHVNLSHWNSDEFISSEYLSRMRTPS